MSRLTKKTYNGNWGIDYTYGDFDTQFSSDKAVYNKLGKLEDLEEELGCPIEVVFEALSNGYIYEDVGTEMVL